MVKAKADKKKAVAIDDSASEKASESEDEKVVEEEAAPAKVEAVATNVAPEDEGKTELFVRNISENTWEESIRKLFEPFGALTKCKHLFAKQCAFIEYGTHEEAA